MWKITDSISIKSKIGRRGGNQGKTVPNWEMCNQSFLVNGPQLFDNVPKVLETHFRALLQGKLDI